MDSIQASTCSLSPHFPDPIRDGLRREKNEFARHEKDALEYRGIEVSASSHANSQGEEGPGCGPVCSLQTIPSCAPQSTKTPPLHESQVAPDNLPSSCLVNVLSRILLLQAPFQNLPADFRRILRAAIQVLRPESIMPDPNKGTYYNVRIKLIEDGLFSNLAFINGTTLGRAPRFMGQYALPVLWSPTYSPSPHASTAGSGLLQTSSLP